MYSLRKLAAAAVLGGAAFAPASFAGTPVDCNAAATGGVVETAGQGRTPDSVGGVCVEGLGYIEVGTNGNQVYVVAESDQFGYVGVSNYENGAKSNCDPSGPDGNEGGSGTNSGGCVGTNGNAVQTGLPVNCGDGTGPWYDSSRDGCRADAEDVDDLIAEIRDLIGQ